MCAQFMIAASLKKIAEKYKAQIRDEDLWKPHVFPRYRAPVIINDGDSRVIRLMSFGLIPFFEKNDKPKKVFHNARSETLSEKISFKRAFTETRCLVPIESFFEYIWENDHDKWIAKIFPKNDGFMTAAGLWNQWKPPIGEPVNSFTIITKSPPPFIENIGHDRCPLWLGESDFDEWLVDEKKSPKDLNNILSHAIDYDYDFEKMDAPIRKKKS